jgi:phenylacetic acid degradation operon negative regulatory protein
MANMTQTKLIDGFVSSLRTTRTSRFIFSSFAFYGPDAGGELAGTWFTRALTPLGVDEMAIRQTLYRMERDGELTSRREGRSKLYAPTATTRLIIEAGSARLAVEAEPPWDGQWTLAHFRLGEESRIARDRLRDLLNTEGFAALAPGLYIHPRDRAAAVSEAARAGGVADRLHLFRGPRVGRTGDDRHFVRELWPLDAIAGRYREFLTRFTPLLRRRGAITDRDAAALRFALVFEYLDVAWSDPGFPPELLPRNWPGHRARGVVGQLYERLRDGARAYGAAMRQS